MYIRPPGISSFLVNGPCGMPNESYRKNEL